MKQRIKSQIQLRRRAALTQCQADNLAEALIVHQHDCRVRLWALAILELLGLSELEYITCWSDGVFND